MDTDIDHYTIEDLLAVLNIQDDHPTEVQIKDTARQLISNLKPDNKQTLTVFIENAERKLLEELFQDEDEDEDAEGDDAEADGGEDDDYSNQGEEDDGGEEDDVAYQNDRTNIQYDENTQQGNWWQNQYPEQTNDEVERTKPTDRKQKVEIFDKEAKDNNAFVMNRQRLGVLQSHPIPYVQGTINPTLKTTIKRIVSIDSQYRPNVIPYSFNNVNSPTFNTDFTFDLTERLTNVLSITLNSIQIPTTWYIFSEDFGNTCFIYQAGEAEQIFVKMPSGNYTLTYLNNFFKTFNPVISLQLSYDEVTGKVVFSSNSPNVRLTFYDTKNFNSCLDNSCGTTQMRINQNFGWSLGYRTTNPNNLSTILNDTSDTVVLASQKLTAATLPYFKIAESLPNLYGPAYFMLVLDDYNNNRVNNSLVTITNVSNKVDLPDYYSPAIKNANNTFATVGCPGDFVPIDPSLNNLPSVLPYLMKSSPRQLTQSQIYTANEILYNRTTYSNKVVGPSTADVLAILPLSNISTLRANVLFNAAGEVTLTSNQISQPYVVFGSSLNMYQRTYFGPVNIDRMRVRLLDDKSNLVNLNDADWSFSLLIEQLYQY
jgi:hypothetical protein